MRYRAPNTGAGSRSGAEDACPDDTASVEQRAWMTLDQHSREVRDQAGVLLKALRPGLPPGTARTVVLAAYLHDVGKAHPIWQDALCELASARGKGPYPGRAWAWNREPSRRSRRCSVRRQAG